MSARQIIDRKLGDVSNVIDSLHETPDYSENGYPMIRVTDIKPGFLKLDYSLKVDEEVYNKFTRKYKPKKGDILISRVGSYNGITTYIDTDEKICLGQNTALISATEINPLYLYYCLQSDDIKHQITAFSVGSAKKTISLKSIKELKIPCPSKEEQIEVGKFLYSIDRKVEINSQITKNLEETVQAIFKRWFIDFEFPNKNGEPYKSSGGEMVESEMGLIPKEWKVKTIDDIVSLIIDYRGKTPKKLGDDWAEKGILALSAKSIKNGELINLDKANYVSLELYKKWMKEELNAGDILMTSEAPLGELYYLADNKKYCLSQRLYAIRANDNVIKSSHLYYELSSQRTQAQIQSRGSGSTVVGIRQTELRKIQIIVPSKEFQEKFAKIANSILKKKSSINEENTRLSQIRDTLLPKLMSGEIRVPLDK